MYSMKKGTTTIDINERFEKTSTFYKKKNDTYQKKTCEFIIFENDRQIGKKEFDMSTQIKMNENDEDHDIQIMLDLKRKISIKVKFIITKESDLQNVRDSEVENQINSRTRN